MQILYPEIKPYAEHCLEVSNNHEIYIEECGSPDGIPVVLIHGFSVPYFIWDPTFRALAEGGMNPVRYDLYGRGYSDRPKAKYNVGLFVEQLLASQQKAETL